MQIKELVLEAMKKAGEPLSLPRGVFGNPSNAKLVAFGINKPR